MRKRLSKLVVLTALFAMIFQVQVFAAGLTVDSSNVANGYVTVSYSGDLSKQTKIVVQKEGGDQYQYDVKSSSPINIPLQMGDGTYNILLAQHAQGDQFAVLQSETISAAISNPAGMFTASNPFVDYDSSMQSIQHYGGQLGGGDMDKLSTLYTDVINNYAYDHAKVNKVTSGYIPVIDEMYNLKQGICFDYASLVGGVLRSQNMPTRLLMGYVPEIDQYHAWNQVLVDGNWVYVDTTLDASYAQAGHDTQMIKDGSGFRVLKIY